jgi:hypothetical protein
MLVVPKGLKQGVLRVSVRHFRVQQEQNVRTH